MPPALLPRAAAPGLTVTPRQPVPPATPLPAREAGAPPQRPAPRQARQPPARPQHQSQMPGSSPASHPEAAPPDKEPRTGERTRSLPARCHAADAWQPSRAPAPEATPGYVAVCRLSSHPGVRRRGDRGAGVAVGADGAEHTRTREQRYHDGLQEAMRRLVASGLLPERAGQPVKMWAHVSLAELRALDDGSVLETQWVTEMRIRWSARRAEAADGTGGDGGAWLDGDAARALVCDAAITPVVTGDVNPGVLDDLVALCLQLTGHGPRCHPQPGADPAGQPAPASNPGLAGSPDPAGEPAPAGCGGPPSGLAVLSGMSREAIRQAIIGKAADL